MSNHHQSFTLHPDPIGFGVTVFPSHSQIAIREVKRHGVGDRAGLKSGDVVISFGDGASVKKAVRVLDVRAYLAACFSASTPAVLTLERPQTRSRSSNYLDSKAKASTRSAGAARQATSVKKLSTEDRQAFRDLKTARKADARYRQTSQEAQAERNDTLRRMRRLRDATLSTPERRQAARDSAQLAQNDFQDATTVGQEECKTRRAEKRKEDSTQSPIKKRLRPTLSPQDVLASSATGRLRYTHNEAASLLFTGVDARTGLRRDRDVLVTSEADALEAWNNHKTTPDYRLSHTHLLTHGSDIDDPIVNRVMAAALSEFNSEAMEIVPTGDVSVGQIDRPPDLPRLLPTTATLSIAVVRFGSTAASGHFVTLATNPQTDEPIQVYDSLNLYTRNDPRYVQHLSKVAAMMKRQDDTAGLRLQFPSILQQSSNGNACGAFAVMYAYALARKVDPATLRLGPESEAEMRRHLHNIIFCSPNNTLSLHYLDCALAQRVRDYPPSTQPFPRQVTCTICPYGASGTVAVTPPPVASLAHFPPLQAANSTARRRLFPQPAQLTHLPALPPQTLAPKTQTAKAPARKTLASSKAKKAVISPTKRKGRARQSKKAPKRKLPPSTTVLPLKRTGKGVPPGSADRCPHCGSFLFAKEAGSPGKVIRMWCCGKGTRLLPRLRPYDEDFYSEGQHINSDFKKNARILNNMAALSCIGVTGNFQTPASGPSFVKIQGRTYHRIFDLTWTSEEHGTRQNQLCILDGQERDRVAASLSVSPQLATSVFAFLYNVNGLYKEYERLSVFPHDDAALVFKTTRRATHGPILGDAPTSEEIAAVITRDADADPRSVRIWKVGDAQAHFISVLDPAYEGLQYPLLHPYAEPGWSPLTKSTKGDRVTLLQYLRLHMLRERRFTDLDRLAQEYFVDMYSVAEEHRLNWHRFNQPKWRQATREEITESMGEQSPDGPKVGRSVVLPSSFSGGPRNMRKLFQDAMAVVHRLGPPTFFVTFTTNPRWPEIQPPGDAIMTARVFKLKLDMLMKDLERVFGGPIIYFLKCVEFQKRGLPHAHIIFKVDRDMTLEEIDRLISAVIPKDPKSQEKVFKHMVHGPCGLANPFSPCMDPECGVCTKHFPKDPTEATHEDEFGRIVYKRPCDAFYQINKGKNTYTISDRDIVPYNLELLMRFDAHINVEACSSSHAIPYLYKYACKGQDRALNLIIEEGMDVDEIADYQNSRYLSSPEAIWRICAFHLHDRSPAVKALSIHLEDRDVLLFPESDPAGALAKTSELTRYLNRPTFAEFDLLTFCDYYGTFREGKEGNETIDHPDGIHHLCRRGSRGIVIRIHWVPLFPNVPKSTFNYIEISGGPSELNYFRMLLLRFPIRSYAEARTVDAVEYETYQEAARALGLVNDCREFFEALEEARPITSASELRNLFVAMVVSQGAGTIPSRLIWDEHEDDLCADFLFRMPRDPAAARNHALIHISRLLCMHGRNLRDEGLPGCQDDSTEVSREGLNWSFPELQDFVDKWTPHLTMEQRNIVDVILMDFPAELQIQWPVSQDWASAAADAVEGSSWGDSEDGKPRLFFLDAPGGSGKTLLLKFLAARLRAFGHVVICVASTGIAALNFQGGLTAHSMFRLPFEAFDPEASCGLSMRSERAALLRSAVLIIYDEVSMVQRNSFSAFLRLLSDLQSPHRQIVLTSGDLRQCPPVIKGGSKNDVLRASIKFSPDFSGATLLRLTRNLRARHDQPFSDMVQAVGDGRVPTLHLPNVERAVIPLPLLQHVLKLDDLIAFTYPNLDSEYECARRAILAGTNSSIDTINEAILRRLPSPSVSFLSADCAQGEDHSRLHIAAETLANFTDVGVPPHNLRLKAGAIAIVTRNLSFDSRLCNSTKVIIRDVTSSRRLITVELPTEDGGPGPLLYIPRINFSFQAGKKGMTIMRRQFPLRLAFAMTFNKSQGQTLDRVGIDLRSDVFSHGQLYVAISRVRGRSDMMAMVNADRVQGGVVHVVNIVFPELITGAAEAKFPSFDHPPTMDADDSFEY